MDEPPAVVSRCHDLSELSLDRHNGPTFVISFDGSDQEIEARQAYPSVRVGYIQIAGVLVRVDEFLNARVDGLVDARKVQRAQTRQTIQTVLPGSQVTRPKMSGVESWRVELFETFKRQAIADFGTPYSLVDALLRLHGDPGQPEASVRTTLGKCPECGQPNQEVGSEPTQCSGCHGALYPTDLLRTHEEYADEGPNADILTRTMNVAERLLSLAYIDNFARYAPMALSSGMFITDGPLAFHGPTAPLKRRMVEYWGRLCRWLQEQGHGVPLLVGIEKTGTFVDHAAAISEHIPAGSVMTLDNTYISEKIRRRASAGIYGKDEFYGRRFFYKTTTEQMLVLTVPRIPSGQPYESGPVDANPCEMLESYPTLRATLEALDRFQTRLYPNAVIPLALAHSAASLPLGTGRDVLTLLAQRGLHLDRNSIGFGRTPSY
ncbi:hypothetical protein [Actinospica robiniae]|uniref:hypothetical protein n=1 Tax=Actinospica robiniae TaxID=304901 RepID=UPI0012FADBB9|nr:hypothetical protein [Actinospica robiniae]